MENEEIKETSTQETTVNDLVQKEADRIKETASNGETNQQQEEEKVDSPNNAAENNNDTSIKKEETPSPVDALLKELGIENLDVLKDRLKTPKPELSPEEKEKEDNIYRANLQKFAVDNGAMKLDDFQKLESLTKTESKDLVYNNWLKDWKEENPNVDPSDVDYLSKEAFEDEFKLNSENEKTKARAEARIEKEAKEIRQPLVSSFETLKKEYDNAVEVKSIFPSFVEKIENLTKEAIPNEYNVFNYKEGETEIPVKITLTEDDKKEILESVSKEVQTGETFSQFKKGDFKPIQDLIKIKTDAFVQNKKREEGLSEVAKTFLGLGVERGSEIGAKAPFHMNQQSGGENRRTKQDAEAEVLESLNGKK